MSTCAFSLSSVENEIESIWKKKIKSSCLTKCEARLTETVQKDMLQLKSLEEKVHEQQSRADLLFP